MLAISRVHYAGQLTQLWLEEQVRHMQGADLQQRIAKAVHEADDVKDALYACLNEVCRYTGWPAGHVLVSADHSRSVLVTSGIWCGASEQRFRQLRQQTQNMKFGFAEGLPGRVLVSDTALWKADGVRVADHPSTAANEATYGDLPPAELCVVPELSLSSVFRFQSEPRQWASLNVFRNTKRARVLI